MFECYLNLQQYQQQSDHLMSKISFVLQTSLIVCLNCCSTFQALFCLFCLALKEQRWRDDHPSMQTNEEEYAKPQAITYLDQHQNASKPNKCSYEKVLRSIHYPLTQPQARLQYSIDPFTTSSLSIPECPPLLTLPNSQLQEQICFSLLLTHLSLKYLYLKHLHPNLYFKHQHLFLFLLFLTARIFQQTLHHHNLQIFFCNQLQLGDKEE